MKLMVLVDIYKCARCGDDHPKMTFRKFKRKLDDYTHWCLCPKTSEPLVMFVKDKDDKH